MCVIDGRNEVEVREGGGHQTWRKEDELSQTPTHPQSLDTIELLNEE